ncbi:MAG: hypothetical protein P0Y64_00600 [Candidatus Sphingomonas colombiensis]|nr:hypothetical protein [Sphingomonas sp.]WEK45122.1 MAG: hypothetical protein P0Y64_00600 [Sphingomonas sp.]
MDVVNAIREVAISNASLAAAAFANVCPFAGAIEVMLVLIATVFMSLDTTVVLLVSLVVVFCPQAASASIAAEVIAIVLMRIFRLPVAGVANVRARPTFRDVLFRDVFTMVELLRVVPR